MAGKEIAVKKYVVRLVAEERDRLNELIRKGKCSAQLSDEGASLKADVLDAGAGWSDSRDARRGAGHHRYCRADQAPAGRGRVGGGCAGPANTIPNPARPADFRRRGGSKLIALDLSPAPEGLCQMEPASARGEGRR